MADAVTPGPPPAFAIGALTDEHAAAHQCLMADRRCAGSRCLGWVRFDDQNGAGNCVHLIAGMRSLR